MRYHFYTNNKNIVVCTSTYAGRIVKGTAKCSPEDEFNYEYGCALAKAKCDVKVAQRREANARRRLKRAMQAASELHIEIDKAQSYLNAASNETYWRNQVLREVKEK